MGHVCAQYILLPQHCISYVQKQEYCRLVFECLNVIFKRVQLSTEAAIIT